MRVPRRASRHRARLCRPHRWALVCFVSLLLAPSWVPLLAQRSSRLPIETAGDDLATSPSIPAAGARRSLLGRTLGDGTSAAHALVAARAQHAALLAARNLSLKAHPALQSYGASWQALGPAAIQSVQYGTVSGRITSIAVDPGDPSGNTVYIGSSGGGVWKSTNAMASPGAVAFSPLTDTLPVFSANADSAATPSLSIGALAAQPGGLVLAGTGDPNDSSDSYYGGGILRSVDGGLTWTLISGANDGSSGYHSFVGLGFSGFAWSTAMPSLIVAALSQSAEGVLVNAADTSYSVMGLYYSTDAGATWRMATIEDGDQYVQRPLPGSGSNGHAVTAVIWNPVRQRFYAAVRYHGYYESTDGQTWTRLAGQPSPALTLAACPTAPGLPGSTACPIFRGALAVDSVTGDMFALTVDLRNHDTGLYRDVCGRSGASACQNAHPTFAAQIPSSVLESPDGAGTVVQGDYNLALAAVPSAGDTVLFAGTRDLFRCSVAAGCVLRNTTNTSNGCNASAHVAPAQHAIATAAAGTPPGVFFGNDSGLWRSIDLVNQQASVCSGDDSAHFQNLNAALGSLADVVSFAQDPNASAVLLTGLGAAGTAATGGNGWLQISAGEGGNVAISPADPSLWYFTSAAGISINLCAHGAACSVADAAFPPVIGPSAVSLDVARLDAPWLLDPNDSTQLINGTCRVWRGPAQDGTRWSASNARSTMLSGPQAATCNALNNPLIRSLAAGGSAPPGSPAPVLYAGMPGLLSGGGTIAGHVLTNLGASSTDAPATWIDVGTTPVTNDSVNRSRFNPGSFDVSSIAVDPHDATGRTVYATILGFANNGVSAPHLYRSVDGGAHWLNISSNLPNAPANSVVVDPNDANTVYVALDTGVYATATVGTCAAANCWTVFGSSLPNAPAIQLAAAANLPTGSGGRGELRVATAGRGVWQIPLLTTLGETQAAITVSTTALAFPSQAAGTIGAAQTVTITNSGAAPLAVSGVTTGGDFQATTGCTDSAVPVGSSCVVQVSFLPAAAGPHAGLLTIYGNVLGGQATVSLSGTAGAPLSVVLSPVTLPFPVTTVGGQSAAENIFVANTGGASTNLTAPQISGDFVVSANTCGVSLAAGTGCTVSVVFAPKASGARTGLFSISTGSGLLSAALSGPGTAPPTDTLSSTSLTFGAQAIGSSSTAQIVIVTNSGDQPLTLIHAAISTGDFTAVNSCGNSLAGHATCVVNVSFAPAQLGTQSGTLTVSDAYRSQTVALTGSGIAPAGFSISPAHVLTFGPTAVNTSAVQTVTLTNNGGLPLTLSNIALTGDFALGAGSTCGGSIAASSACKLNIAFTPTTTGARFGTLTLTDSSPTSPHALSLSGSGLDFTIGADGQTSATISSGASAAFPLLVSSAAGLTGAADITCTGVPANSTCVLSPASVPFGAGGATLVVATVGTGVSTTAAHASPPSQAGRSGLWFAALLPVPLLLLRGRRHLKVWSALLLLPLALAGFSGCSTGRTIPPAGSGSGSAADGAITPSGTYTIAVVVSSGGLSRELDFTLIVQ